LKTKHKWREHWDNEDLTKEDEEREQEAEEEGDEKERKGEKAENSKGGDKCGCCCHDNDGRHGSKGDRAKWGEPDDEDDVIEIHPKPPKRPVITGGGGGKVTPPKPPPRPQPTPPKPPGKGEKNEEYGLYVERPFYIISMCGEKRYLDVVGSNIVVKTPNEFDSQVWYFDQNTKTIKNTLQKSKSLDIQSSGNTSNMQLWSTNG
jgi:hypothetical protein